MIVALKTIGYLISIVSVMLLGLVAWQTVAHDPFLRLCLMGGVSASIIGMVFRWISHLKDQQEKNRAAAAGLPAATSAVDSSPPPANARRPAQARLYVAATDHPSSSHAGSRAGSA